MRKIIPALAAGFVGTVAAGSAAQAAVIDFAVDVIGSTISYTGPRLNLSTALNLDGTPLDVTAVEPGDASGLAVGDSITVSPTSIGYGTGTLVADIDKTWTATTGPHVGDVFTEVLTTVDSIDRSTRNAITVTLSGTVSDSEGFFKSDNATMILSATQTGGPGNVVSASLTNAASSVPEPSTWAMLALGFAGLGYVAVRRNAKDKAAIAI